MKRKKLIGLMLSAAIGITSLTGCGNTNSTGTADSGAPESSDAAQDTETTGTESTGTETAASGERVKLEIWDWWGEGQYKYVIEQLCQNFN